MLEASEDRGLEAQHRRDLYHNESASQLLFKAQIDPGRSTSPKLFDDAKATKVVADGRPFRIAQLTCQVLLDFELLFNGMEDAAAKFPETIAMHGQID